MASKTRVITLPAPSNVTYGLVRTAGSELKGFRLTREDPAGYYFKFARGFGWTNPTDLEVTIYQLDAQSSQLRLDASILALADPDLARRLCTERAENVRSVLARDEALQARLVPRPG